MNKRLLILGTLGEFEQLVQKARAGASIPSFVTDTRTVRHVPLQTNLM